MGFIDAKATTLALTINNQDLTITQSPSVLSSNRSGGTTGAVVWKVTPLFAGWLSAPNNLLFRTGILAHPGRQQDGSTVLELGCGVSGLVGLATAPLVGRYVLTDQSYVARLVEANIAQYKPAAPSSRKTHAAISGRKGGRPKPLPPPAVAPGRDATLHFRALDWETDTPHATLCGTPDVVVACDCIYNDALIVPLVSTIFETCRLKTAAGGREGEDKSAQTPCVAVVAQQLRDPEIFEAWLREFMAKGFRVWRVPDGELPEGLRESSGFVVHAGILKEAFDGRPA